MKSRLLLPGKPSNSTRATKPALGPSKSVTSFALAGTRRSTHIFGVQHFKMQSLPLGIDHKVECFSEEDFRELPPEQPLPLHIPHPVVMTSQLQKQGVTFYPTMGLMAYCGDLYCFYRPPPRGVPWREHPHISFREMVSKTQGVALAHRMEDLIEEKYMAKKWHPIFGGYLQPMEVCVYLACEEIDSFDFEQPPFGLWLDFERRYFGLHLLCRLQARVGLWLKHRRFWRLAAKVLAERCSGPQGRVFSNRELFGLILMHMGFSTNFLL